MIFALDVDDQLVTLLNRWTQAHADALANNLNAPVGNMATAAALQTVDNNVDALVARLTAARAGYLDLLNSRLTAEVAPKSTALSSAVWTAAKAAKIGTAKSRNSGYVDGANPMTGSGEDTRYYDITIPSVDPDNCWVRFDGVCSSRGDSVLWAGGGSGTVASVTARLVSATKLRLSTNDNAAALAFYGRWTVLELTGV